MNRIIILGSPGSGKSTFARALHEIIGLPLYHLDNLHWNADITTVSKFVFRERLHPILQTDCWIIDGTYLSTIEPRLQACDTVFFLDYPVALCLESVLARRGKARSDLPWIEPADTIDSEFLQYIKDYPTETKPIILEMLHRYNDKAIYQFQSRKEAEDFLVQISNERR